jgi:cytochrome P450
VRKARELSWYALTPYGIAVLRYEDVGKLLRDPRLRQGSYAWPAHNKVTGVFADWWLRIVLNRVGEDHARLRRLASPAFSPKLIVSLRPKFAALANDIVDEFAARGRCDFMAEFSEPYVTRVICILLNLDQSEWRRLADICADMGLALGVTFKRDAATIDRATSALFEYAYRVVEERRAQPSDEDFISQLLQANENKDALSDQELYDMVMLAVFGGIDTTRNQLGLAMSIFLEYPDQWRVLAEQPELARNAVEEVMRVRPTTTWVTREATEDFTYRDLELTRGTTIHLFSESAGTDPRQFAPDFNITAESKAHFGFGAGPHHCLGHFIARADLTEALRVLPRRMRNPRLDGEAIWLPDSGNTGPVTLPIAFDP